MQSVDFSTPPEELKRGTRLGQYELLLRIGRGGMATVWVARQPGPTREQDRLVAVKAILSDLAGDQEFVKMFLDEGRIVRLIRHANVVDVYEVGQDRGVMFMSMEWVEGDTLHAIIAEAGKRRPIPWEMGVRIIADAASGLHAAHELRDDQGQLMNVVHRDVSPHNILIGADGAIKLVDFGVARAMGRISEVTSAGQLKGKFGYMSPEQAMARKTDRRADVFALGIVLFELTTGRRLFRGEHDAETLHLVVSGKIPPPSSFDPKYPKALESIVMKALERDLDKRYATALQLQDALEAFLKSERVVVPRAGVANLLRKVLGQRMDQRRKAIRSALRAIDGEVPMGSNVPPSDPIAASAPPSEHASVSSVTSPSAVAGPPSSPSSPSGLSNASGVSTSGTRPAGQGVYDGGFSASQLSSTSQLSNPSQSARSGAGYTPSPTIVVKRGGILGYVIGVIGLAVALAVMLYFVLNPQRRTTILNLGQSAAPAQPPPTEIESTAPDEAVQLPQPSAAPSSSVPPKPPAKAQKPAPRAAPRKPWRPPPKTAPAPKPQAPAPGAAPPRKNPYE